MNTKQIWQALAGNPVTSEFFEGVYASDTLKEIQKRPRLVVSNTDPSGRSGTHWVAFFFEGDNVDFFDSLGQLMSEYSPHFVNFSKQFASSFNYAKIRTQPINSDLCGYYCIYFAYHRCLGKSFESVIRALQKETGASVKDFVGRNFCFCVDSDCKYLQKSCYQ